MKLFTRKWARTRARLSDSGGLPQTRTTGRRPVAIGIAGALLLGLPAVLVGVSSGTSSAITPNLPVFPNSLDVFPNRDFLMVTGYKEHHGEQATVTVTRAGAIVGSAIGTVGSVVDGDVAFEVNHPGGICWGAGTALQVTPDIQPGDLVRITIPASAGGPAVDDATEVQDANAFDGVLNGTRLVVSGHIGANVNRENVEQRIIEPALVDTIIGKRDIRAVPTIPLTDPPVLTVAPKGGYASMLEFDVNGPNTFRATYEFAIDGVSPADALANATIAANATLGERMMAWEFTDPAANRQGMSIAENGELGGPGFGGCPMGPNQAGPLGPTNVVAHAVPTGIQVTWTPVTAIPGTPPVLGYEVTAVGQTVVNGEQVQIGKRITNPLAGTTTLTGLDPLETYVIEIATFSSVGKTFPPVSAVVDVDLVPPTVSASPGGGSYAVAQQVTLTANEPNSQIFYTTDGTDPITGPQASISHYTGPITISADTPLSFVAYDPASNVSTVVTEAYVISNNPVPAATTFTTSSVALNSVTLNWNAADPVAGSIVDYRINVYATALAPTPLQSPTFGNVLTATINGLTGDTPYWFTVSAMNSVNGAFGPESARLTLTPQGALVAIAGPDQTGVVRNTQVALTGAGSSTAGATYAWTQLITGTTTPMPAGIDRVTLATPTAISTTFTLPFYAFPMSNKPLTFQLAVTVGLTTATDVVVITPRSDVVSISSAKWKIGDFRIGGTSTTVGAVVTVRTATGVIYGTATVAAGGVYDVRNRTGVPAAKPATIFVDSNMGGTAGPFTVV